MSEQLRTHAPIDEAEAAGKAVILIDVSGVVRYWNPAAEDLFGFAAANMIGEHVSRMIPERLREPHERGFTAAMERGALASDGQPRRTKAIRPDGEKIYVEMAFGVVTDDAGTALGALATATAA